MRLSGRCSTASALLLTSICFTLVLGESFASFQRIQQLRDSRTKGILLRSPSNYEPRSLQARQGGLASTLLAGPMFLALSSLLFSFPVLPMLFLAPMALSNFLPNLEDGSEQSLSDILSTVQNLGQGILNGIRPGSSGLSSPASMAAAITQALSAQSQSASGSSSSSSSSPTASQASPSSSSNSSSPAATTAAASPSVSSSSSADTISAVGSASEPIASIVPATSSSSSSSSSSVPTSSLYSAANDPLSDLSTGFLSQLAAINDILSNNNNSPTSGNSPLSPLSQLAANTLASLSNFLFSSKREETRNNPLKWSPLRFRLKSKPMARSGSSLSSPLLPFRLSNYQQSIPGQPRINLINRLSNIKYQAVLSNPSQTAANFVHRFREIYSTFRDGLKRYEISESECQARLICELHQKAIGKSIRNWIKTVTDFIRLDNRLQTLGMANRAKSTLIDFYQAARRGMSDEECALAYSRCPVNIAVEPLNNSIMSKLFGKRNKVKAAAAPTTPVNSNGNSGKTVMISGNSIYTPGFPGQQQQQVQDNKPSASRRIHY